MELVALEAVYSVLDAHAKELEATIRRLEEVGNNDATIAFRAWRLVIMSLNAELANLIAMLSKGGSPILASSHACKLENLAMTALRRAESSELYPIAFRSKKAIALLKDLAGNLCRRGMSANRPLPSE